MKKIILFLLLSLLVMHLRAIELTIKTEPVLLYRSGLEPVNTAQMYVSAEEAVAAMQAYASTFQRYLSWCSDGRRQGSTTESYNNCNPELGETVNGKSLRWFCDLIRTSSCPETLVSHGYLGAWLAGYECPRGFIQNTIMINGARQVSCERKIEIKDHVSGVCPVTPNPVYGETGVKQQYEADYIDPHNLLDFGRTWRSDQNRFVDSSESKIMSILQGQSQVGWCYYDFYKQVDLDGQENEISHCFNYINDVGAIWFVSNGDRIVLSGDINFPVDINGKVKRVLGSEGKATWSVLTEDGVLEYYGNDGLIQKKYLPDGRRIFFNWEYYSGSDLGAQNQTILLTISDANDRKIILSYGSDWKINKLIDPSGSVTQYSYDELTGNCPSVVKSGRCRRLTSVTYPDGRVRRYHYGDNGHLDPSLLVLDSYLTGITDENGNRLSEYSYDSQGRVILSGRGGNYYQLSYEINNTYVTDPLGSKRSYSYQNVLGRKRMIGVSQPGGSGCGASASAVTYDANGNVASSTDFNGVKTNYSYDLSRNLETKRVEAVGKAEERTISSQWHSYWRQPVKVAEPGKLTTWVYNGDGGKYCAPTTATVPSINGGTQPIGVVCSKTEQATSDATGGSGLGATVVGSPRTWKYTYNEYGQMLTADGPRTDVSDLSTYTYYSATDPDMGKRGNLSSVTNGLGHKTQITAYDLNGNPLTIIDANGVTTTLSYDLRQRLTSRSVGGEKTSYTYDGVGQLLKVTLPDGSVTNYTYDAAHRLTDISDALGNKIHYTLDAMGNRTKEEVKDPGGVLARTQQHIYDALSRLAQDIGASGQTTAYEYDANGNRTKVTDPLGQSTLSNYDGLNRLIAVTDPGKGKTSYGYDGRDQLTAVTDARNLKTSYTIDGLGNRIQQQSPDTGTTVSSYDAAGNEVTRKDAKGQITTWQYDVLNRPTVVTYADGNKTSYGWDSGTNGKGRLTQISDMDNTGAIQSSIKYSYDGLGRVSSEQRTVGSVTHTVAYTYSGGQLASLILPSAKQLKYSRNAAGQITKIDLISNGSTKTIVSGISYFPFGGVKGFTDGAGQGHNRSFDQDGRIKGYSLGTQNWSVSYDKAGRIVGLGESGNAANSATYGYDALDHLTRAAVPGTVYGYNYDAVGNRTVQTLGGTSRNYTMGTTSNRLQGLTNPTQSLNYDANGSLLGDGQSSYGYDARGRLKQGTKGGSVAQYRVNALGQRIGKTVTENGSSVVTIYQYDHAGRLVGEADGQGVIQREYIWLDDLPVAVLQ